MRFTNIRLDDFGCFRGARMDDILEDFVVVAGPQRAGKTTFMQALRQFRNGVARGDSLPGATDEYRVEAEITHRGHEYVYRLNGYANPVVSPVGDAPELDADEIFGPVTAQQYRQLYTISLDELEKLPPGIDSSEDLARVLLGGAYGDIASIPTVREWFSDRADTIGLTRGDPTTKTSQLHGPYSTVKAGMDQRREANAQVSEHAEITRELARKEQERTDARDERAELQTERDRLGILRELYEDIQDLKQLESTALPMDEAVADAFPTNAADRLEAFEEDFETATDAVNHAERDANRGWRLDEGESYHEWLVAHRGDIRDAEAERSRYEDRIETLRATRTQLDEERDAIESDIGGSHSAWGPSFEHVDAVETSTVDVSRVKSLTEAVDRLESECDELEEELSGKQRAVESLQADLEGMAADQPTETTATIPRTKPAIAAVAGVVVGGAAAALVNPIAGLIAGLIVSMALVYALDFSTEVELTVDVEPRERIKGEISSAESRIDEIRAKLERKQTALYEKREELEEVRDDLGLPEVPTDGLAEFYGNVVALDERIHDYHADRDAWEADRDALFAELRDLDRLLGARVNTVWSDEESLAAAESLVATLEDATSDLKLAITVAEARDQRADVIRDINSVLAQWDESQTLEPDADDDPVRSRIEAFRQRADEAEATEAIVSEYAEVQRRITTRLDSQSAVEAFDPIRETADEELIDVARRCADTYADSDAIATAIADKEAKIDDRTTEIDELNQSIVELENQRDSLASEDDLREAEEQISEGAADLERLGEEYAVNRIAAEMLDHLHTRLMEDLVDGLVDDASEIFSRITREYSGIELEMGEGLENLTFRALRDAQPDHGIDALSRATRDQLFLAIRLARIRQTNVELPVVIDDAATNFDPDHATRVFDVVSELSMTNQVFFLTCHPSFVELASNSGSSPQLWALEDGQFTRESDVPALNRRLAAD